MSKKVTGVLAYIHIIGWIIAFIAGDREGAKVHLNQGLVLWIISLIGGVIALIPLIGSIIGAIINVVCLVFMIMGIVYAVTDKDEELPLIGAIHLLK